MKRIKNSKAVKVLALLMAVCILVLPMLTSCDSLQVDWEISEDQNVLYRNGVPYYKVEDPSFFSFCHKEYEFMDSVTLQYDGYTYSTFVYSYANDGLYAWVDNTLYVCDEGRYLFDQLKSFDAVSQYMMTGIGGYAVLDEAMTDGMFEEIRSSKAQSMDFALLKYRTQYDLDAIHTDENLCYTFAKIYLIDGNWYYLDLSTLSDEHYDEYGDLNYRDGKVDVYLLSQTTCEKILEAESLLGSDSEKIEGYYKTEASDVLYKWIENNGVSIAVAVMLIVGILFFALGFILPLPVYALGLILPRIKRLGKPKYWYSLCAFAGMWSLLFVVMFIVVALAVLL